MNRRTFLCATGATLIAGPTLAIGLDYTPGLVRERLAAGETVFVDFAADWCTTCRAQERRISALLAANPAYEANITFVRVDWDDFGRGELSTTLKIPRRSTLVVLKGDQELGRLVAQTSEGPIKRLLDTALTAASSS